MLLRSFALLVGVAALSTGCALAITVSAPRVSVPITAVTGPQDEWLHDHCTPRKLVSADSLADADRQVRASAANFGEVVYETRSLQIVAYDCPGRSSWAGTAVETAPAAP